MRVGTSRTSRRCTMAASLTGHRRHCARRASPLPSTCVSPDRARSQSHISQKEGRMESLVSLKETRWMRGTHMFCAPPPPHPYPYPYQNINKSTCITFKIVSLIQVNTTTVRVAVFSLPGNYERGTRTHPGAQCWRSYLAPSPSLAMARGQPPWPWFARGQPPWPWWRPLPPPDATPCSEPSSTVS